MKKLTIAVAASLLLTQIPLTVSAQNVSMNVTRDELVNYLMHAADGYNPSLSHEAILKGYERISGDQPVTRLDALVMLSRAFGELPAPTFNDKLTGNVGATFKDIPSSALSEMSNLTNAGVLSGYPNGMLGAKDLASKQQIVTLVDRIFAIEGNNPRDDFYAYVNKNWLSTATIPPGKPISTTLGVASENNNIKLTTILKDLVSKQQFSNTREQQLAGLYSSALDVEHRNQQGLAPIAPYLTQIDKSSTIQELFNASISIEKETSFQTLVNFGVMPDFKDSTRGALLFTGLRVGVPDIEAYAFGNPDNDAQYIDYVTRLFVLAAVPEQQAAAQAKAVYAFEQQINAGGSDDAQGDSVDSIYNPYTKEKLASLFKSVDLLRMLNELGYSTASQIIVPDVKAANDGAKLLSDKNVDVLKLYMKANLLKDASTMLTTDFADAKDQFQAALLGTQGQGTLEQKALVLVKEKLSGPLGELFAEKYFSKEAKADVEQMIQQFLVEYKKKLEKIDWLTPATKAKALKKLDTMSVKVGYPDKPDTSLDHVIVQNYENGGSLFKNMTAIEKAQSQKRIGVIGQTFDRNYWELNVFDVNAMYLSQMNSIEFPAGILQAPMYDPTAKRESNLGAIGVIIAHEITHAFDPSGSQYDEAGNAVNWWTPGDYAAFQKKCAKVVAAYDGIEIIPGVYNNGELTLDENVADLGGMSAALQVMSHLENPDYKAFFEGWAKSWASVAGKKVRKQLTVIDNHSADKVRVNRTVANFPEFYQAYGVTETNGMYIEPEDRVSIW